MSKRKEQQEALRQERIERERELEDRERGATYCFPFSEEDIAKLHAPLSDIDIKSHYELEVRDHEGTIHVRVSTPSTSDNQAILNIAGLLYEMYGHGNEENPGLGYDVILIEVINKEERYEQTWTDFGS